MQFHEFILREARGETWQLSFQRIKGYVRQASVCFNDD